MWAYFLFQVMDAIILQVLIFLATIWYIICSAKQRNKIFLAVKCQYSLDPASSSFELVLVHCLPHQTLHPDHDSQLMTCVDVCSWLDHCICHFQKICLSTHCPRDFTKCNKQKIQNPTKTNTFQQQSWRRFLYSRVWCRGEWYTFIVTA